MKHRHKRLPVRNYWRARRITSDAMIQTLQTAIAT
jgi:hypothetical protein